MTVYYRTPEEAQRALESTPESKWTGRETVKVSRKGYFVGKRSAPRRSKTKR